MLLHFIDRRIYTYCLHIFIILIQYLTEVIYEYRALFMEGENMGMGKLIFGTGASSSKDYSSLKRVVRSVMENKIYSFDTAPSYGTESVLGKIIRELSCEMELDRETLFIQTKIDPLQMQESDGDIRKYVTFALKQMDLEYFDSLLIHWPIPEYFDRTWESFVKIREEKLSHKIGICNVRMRHLKGYLGADSIPDIIQIERNPLRTCEKEISFCHQHGIDVQAYSPLCKMDERLRDNEILKRISEKYGKSVGQIILRWHIDTGVTPIFTSTKPIRVREYASIFDYKLSKNEIKEISSLNIDYKMYLESMSCPGL